MPLRGDITTLRHHSLKTDPGPPLRQTLDLLEGRPWTVLDPLLYALGKGPNTDCVDFAATKNLKLAPLIVVARLNAELR